MDYIIVKGILLLVHYVIKLIKTSIMNTSFYPVNSSDFLTSIYNKNSPPKIRYKPQRTIRFKQQDNEDQGSRLCKGGLSLDKLRYTKIKEQREILENSKLPSFNIKRLIDRSIRKRKQLKNHFSNETSPTREKAKQNKKEDLRIYWHQYLKNQTFKQTPIDSNRKNRTRYIIAEHSSKQKTREEKQKELLTTNNFIKTNYRKRLHQRLNLNQQLSLRQRRSALGQGLKSKKSINWMSPWEKGYIQNEQQPFSYT